MPSVVYAFDVNQSVWCVDKQFGVRPAIIKDVEISSNTNNITPLIQYTVVFTAITSGNTLLPESAVFSDIDSALAAYKTIITA